MKQKTILIVLPYGFNDRMTNFLEFVVARLLAREGWRVLGLTRQERSEPREHIVHGIRVFRYAGTFGGIFLVLRLMLRMRPDVVHVHTLRNNRIGIIAAMFAKLLGIPLAFSEAGLLHDHYLVDDRDDPLLKPVHYERIARSLSGGLRSYLFHWPLMHADRVAFFSKHNLPIAEKLGLSAVYIPQILDGERWSSSESGTHGDAKVPNEPYGLFVGQMKKRKGWDVLLRAIPLVPVNVLPKFVIVSSSRSESDEYVRLVSELSIGNRLIFLGAVSNRELRTIFEKSTLVVVPSRYEGFGLVPLDAFEAHTPVVASRVEALTDFLVDGENARLIDPKDSEALARALVEVVTNARLREHIIAGGTKVLERMKSKEEAGTWLIFYEQLLRLSHEPSAQ